MSFTYIAIEGLALIIFFYLVEKVVEDLIKKSKESQK